MNKKIILGIIIGGIIFGSVGVYAGSNFYANGISVSAPTGSNLGSDATLQNSLDELYSIADKYDELKTEINTLKNNTSKEYLNKIYPIGSIYMSMNNTSPATFLGGTWEPLKDRFLIGAGNSYSVNSTGGSTSHSQKALKLRHYKLPITFHLVSLNPHSHSHYYIFSYPYDYFFYTIKVLKIF